MGAGTQLVCGEAAVRRGYTSEGFAPELKACGERDPREAKRMWVLLWEAD